MKFDDVAPIIEGRLYNWGLMRRNYPDVQIASYSERIGRSETPDLTSPQEAWAIRNARDLQDALVIEETLSKMSDGQKKLVWMRYVEREQWRQIAKAIHVSEQQIYRERDQVLAIFAYAFEMLEENGAAS